MPNPKTKGSRSARKETASDAGPLIDLGVLDPLDRCLFMHCVEAVPLKELNVWFKLIAERRIFTKERRVQGSLDDSSRSNVSEVTQTDQRIGANEKESANAATQSSGKASSVRPAVKQSYGS